MQAETGLDHAAVPRERFLKFHRVADPIVHPNADYVIAGHFYTSSVVLFSTHFFNFSTIISDYETYVNSSIKTDRQFCANFEGAMSEYRAVFLYLAY